MLHEESLELLYNPENPQESLEFLNQLLSSFEDLVAQSFKEFDLSVPLCSHSDIARTAHRLKSSCGSLGALEMANFCASLEAQAKKEDSTQYQHLLEALRIEYASVATSLKNYMDRKNASK